ncbi:MAG: C-GCAxxG-C-C family protein [Lawsonibacter sp.]
MDRMEHTKALRASTDVHYNCCQSVLLTFAQEMGLSDAQAYALGSHFASGMLHGATCGALSGALMVLGALGYDKPQAVALIRQFREKHGATDCAALLSASHERGEAKKDHCDGLVYEMVAELDAMLSQD